MRRLAGVWVGKQGLQELAGKAMTLTAGTFHGEVEDVLANDIHTVVVARHRYFEQLRDPGAFHDAWARPTRKFQGAVHTMSLEAVFSAQAVTKFYDMGEVRVHALRGVDIELFAGEMMVLLGPSGSGKSTLLNILGGLDRASDGTVLYRGFDITRAKDGELTQYRRSHVGFVFQFYNLIPSLTAMENVAAVTEIAENPMKPAEALDLVGLGDRLHHFPSQLSGGQQQRVAIARAIAKRPSVLLCDEPTGALDSETGIVVLEAIDKVNRELGAATAVITHNADIAGMADRVVHMSNGNVSKVERNPQRRNPRDLHW